MNKNRVKRNPMKLNYNLFGQDFELWFMSEGFATSFAKSLVKNGVPEVTLTNLKGKVKTLKAG